MCGWLIARTQWYSWVCWDRSINDLLWVKFLFHLHHFSRAWRKNLATNLFLVCFLFPVLSICVNLCTSSRFDQLLYKEARQIVRWRYTIVQCISKLLQANSKDRRLRLMPVCCGVTVCLCHFQITELAESHAMLIKLVISVYTIWMTMYKSTNQYNDIRHACGLVGWGFFFRVWFYEILGKNACVMLQWLIMMYSLTTQKQFEAECFTTHYQNMKKQRTCRCLNWSSDETHDCL